MSFSLEIHLQSSNLTSIHTDNAPIVCRPTHLSVHNAYYWKVGQYQSMLSNSRRRASRSSRVTKQEERRRRQRQRKREQKARPRKSVEPSLDDELIMRMQAWAVHEPKQMTPKEGSEPEHIDRTESIEKHGTNDGAIPE